MAASIKKHPLHPMLVPFPIALWIFSLVSDLIVVLGLGGPVWKDVAFYTMAGGFVGALAAAAPGYLDYRSLTDSQTSNIAWWHMVINLTIVGLFAVNIIWRVNSEPASTLPVILSIVGVSMLGISGWLGGELVYVHGVGVDRARGGREKSGNSKGSAMSHTRTGT